MRFDKVVRSAGFFRNMKTYSIIFENEHLYLINTGPADRPVRIQNVLQEKAISKLKEMYAKKIAEGEKQLSAMSPEQLSQQKHNANIAAQDIRSLRLKKDIRGLPKLILITPQGNFSFQFREHSMEDVEQLVHALTSHA